MVLDLPGEVLPRFIEIDSTDIGRILICSDHQIGSAIGIPVATGERIAEVIARRFARDGHIGRRGRRRDGAVIVEEIDAAGVGGIATCSDSQVRPTIGIVVARGEGIAETN